MAKEDKNEEIESEATNEMEEKAKKRERKKKREMDVSGKSVFKEQELRIKNSRREGRDPVSSMDAEASGQELRDNKDVDKLDS